jgi:leader peptidase (prepilin peptidase)/N-methyltransferase
MEIFWIILFFLFGLAGGSFLNAVIYRIDNIMSIARERSQCPHCKKEIAWYDLVPLLSFVALRGICRHCGKKISWQYPIIELTTAILFVVLYLSVGLNWYTVFLAIISMFLIVIFVVDLREMIIPDIMVIPALVFWAIVWIISLIPGIDLGMPVDFVNYLYGGLLGAGFIGLIVLITKNKGMGVGDIKLAGLIGFVLGWPFALIGLLAAFVVGSIVGIIMLINKTKNLKSEIPFAPYLIIGFYIAVFWGTSIINWYTR